MSRVGHPQRRTGGCTGRPVGERKRFGSVDREREVERGWNRTTGGVGPMEEAVVGAESEGPGRA